MSGKVLFVGESNPYGADPYFALYPVPDGCAGHRLCTLILGLGRKEYLERFDRENLCSRRWNLREARERAESLWREATQELDRPAIVLLGRKVAAAFTLPLLKPLQPFEVENNCTDTVVVCLPHPSGLCRVWDEEGAFEKARSVLRSAGIKLD